MNTIGNKIKNGLGIYLGLPGAVYILFFGKLINCIGAFISPLLSLILTQKIGMSVNESGFFVTMAMVIQAPCVIVGGKLVDKYGGKKVIGIFQGLSGILFMICGLINPSRELAILMIVASAISSISYPAYDSIVGDVTNLKNRKASFSLIYMGLNIGFSVGPAIGGLLFQKHLELIFIGDGFTTLISAALIGIFIKGKHHKSNENTDENSLEAAEEGSVLSVLIKRPILLYYALAMLTYSFAYSQWGYAIPIHLEQLFNGSGAKYFGILGSINGFVVIVLTPLITALTRKYNIIKIIATGGILYFVAFGSCSIIKSFPLFIVMIIIMTIGEILISTNSGTFLTNNTPESHRGRVNAVIPMISGIGTSIGPLIMGNMITSLSINKAWFVVSMVVLIGSICMYSLSKMKHRNV
ncbi:MULTISPECIES: MFS transporter [Clostridium]|uniref:MFS transporter n=1 Tax=Clostridium cibarium TaxID=2762247 RepID=A0ABR8PYF3_9CLOT|nr:MULTISPECIES: MFS transporter [Clostridium]MBD7913205.1 MFS transporter [Clostridium cibarium]